MVPDWVTAKAVSVVCDALDAAILIKVLATLPDADRSSRFPVVVPVSTDVEDNAANDPPLAITDVVWGMLKP